MRLEITRKQQDFINAEADEVLYGGAAGGGKSYGQLIDALIYALRYPKSKQLILRRTLPELDKSIIRVSLSLYPQVIFSYKQARHLGEFVNGSIIDYGYCDNDNDVFRYQSAEYDVIRFDELTHFSEEMYIYLLSRCRGANSFPKQIKSTTNPGGIGHGWVKKRFIDIGAADTLHRCGQLTRIFIPAGVFDNRFLMKLDPMYIKRLDMLSESDKKALLHGQWDLFEGQYFDEWDRALHVMKPFEVPTEWNAYCAIDYGLDMLAAYIICIDGFGNGYVTDELYEGKDNGTSGHVVSSAAARVKELIGSRNVRQIYAPPDLWNRQKDTGNSIAKLFALGGVRLTRVDNRRVQGWLGLKEWLKPKVSETGEVLPRLRIFDRCVNLIRTLPALQCDRKNPSDVACYPHELTHGADALRYFAAGMPKPMEGCISERQYGFSVERSKGSATGLGDKQRII